MKENDELLNRGSEYGETQSDNGENESIQYTAQRYAMQQGEEQFYTNGEVNSLAGGSQQSMGQYLAATFGWMAFGLLLTFGVAFGAYHSGFWWKALSAMPVLPIVLAVAEVVVVIVFSAKLMKLSISAAHGLFFAYAVLNGLTFSSFFLLYDVSFLIYVFGITALYFGVMALYGYLTKSDLSSFHKILFVALIFSLVYWVVSMFINIPMVDRVMCYVGVAIFMGYTAYDTQKVKRLYEETINDSEMASKASIYSALQLYLDFINLFLYLLRILGRRRSN